MFYGGEFMVKKTNFFEVAPKAMGNLIRMETISEMSQRLIQLLKNLLRFVLHKLMVVLIA